MNDIADIKTPKGFKAFTLMLKQPQYKFIENNQEINVKYYKIEKMNCL